MSIRQAFLASLYCLRPDPAKTKVLYNSKVLDISCKKDETGKRVVLFLIHFQGWNSAWDRFVTEDYVLKDTEENRKLQRELAEKAQLTPGGNLYRRERKKRNRKLSERVVDSGGEGKKGGVSSDSDTSEDDRPVQHSHLPLAISDNLKLILQNDFKRISCQNKVLNLPAIPNAVDILQSFLRDFATAQMKRLCNRKSNFEVTLGNNITPESVCTSFNLCREVVDSIRLYVDFMLEKILLYPQERNQYVLAINGKLMREIEIKKEVPDASEVSSITIKEEPDMDDVVETDRRRTLRSHQVNLEQQIAPPPPPPPPASNHNSCNGRTSNRSSSGEFSGRLEGTAEEDDEPANKIRRKKRNEQKSRAMTAREEELLEKVLKWNVIPDKLKDQVPKPNSLIYGATHLARMFVKLPELVLSSPHSGAKTNLLVEYLNHFMRYLEVHPEWFNDSQYRDNIYASLTDELINSDKLM